MATTTQLSRLMKMSWTIQKDKGITRSKSLQTAWAIFHNEDVVIHYLVKRLNHNKPLPVKAYNMVVLFPA